MKFTVLVIALSLLGGVGLSHAEAIGQFKRSTAAFGYVAGVGRLAVDDPDGPTGGEMIIQPAAIAYTRKLSGALRYWIEPYVQSATLDASTERIGQDVTRFGARLSLQALHARAARLLPWIGAGLDLAHSRYEARHTVDVDGFLARRFPDRNETSASLLVNAAREWRLADGRSLHGRLEYVSPIGGDTSLLSVSLAYLFDR